jgi:hypothetical protein
MYIPSQVLDQGTGYIRMCLNRAMISLALDLRLSGFCAVLCALCSALWKN